MNERANKSDASPLDFEKALTRLEALVSEMEGGKLTLDQMMAHFEEGSKLVKVCDQKLNEVEKKIEKLVKRGDAIATEPFTPAEPD